jgi:hypothetical protein
MTTQDTTLDAERARTTEYGLLCSAVPALIAVFVVGSVVIAAVGQATLTFIP